MALIVREEKLLSTDGIDIGDRYLHPTQERVDALARELETDGVQLSPIHVRQVTRNSYKVVCGATRLLAIRQLQWPRIRALIVAGLPVDYQIAELSENRHRQHLTRDERADIDRRLKELRRQREEAAVKDALTTVAPSKGGRGKKGGLREAARQAGVPLATVQDRAKKLTGSVQNRSVSGHHPTQTVRFGPVFERHPPPPRAPTQQKIHCPTCGSLVSRDKIQSGELHEIALNGGME